MKPLAELVELKSSAIIVVDMQHDFCSPKGACGIAGGNLDPIQQMIPRLRKFLGDAREIGANLIFIQCIHENATDSDAWIARHKGGPRNVCRRGSWGAEFIGDGIEPRGDETVVIKHRYSAFTDTRLGAVLRTANIKTLIMTGVGTNVCVESTARDGFMLDYNIVFLSDCTQTATPGGAHEATLNNIKHHFGTVATSDEVVAEWQKTAAQPALA